ncbi:MAG: hypothetical protein CL609_06160 [Anaerolineaceae bacterium]|nr:hypothetical protein [Anaerolineaceae bacterium]
MSEKLFFNRRGFLKRSLGTLGGAFLVGWMPVVESDLKSAVLLIPKNALSEESLQMLLKGLKTGLESSHHSPVQLNVVVDQFSVSGLKKSVKEICLQPNNHVILGYFSHQQVAWIKPVVEEFGKHLIVISLGENKVDHRQQSPYIHYVDLGLSRAAYYLGQWSAAMFGKNCTMVTEPHLSGYDYFYGFRSGFEQMGGVIKDLHFVSETGDLRDYNENLGKTSDFIFTNLSQDCQALFSSRINKPQVSVIAGLWGAKQVYSINSWGNSHPLSILGEETAQLVLQQIESKNKLGFGQVMLSEHCVYERPSCKVYRRSSVTEYQTLMTEICLPYVDQMALSDLDLVRSQISTPLYL